MSGKYEYIDHTADIVVKISADSMNDLFYQGAEALINRSVSEVRFRETEIKKINLNEYSAEELLASFLNEINFLFTVRKWLVKKIIRLSIEEYESIWQLKAECEGGSRVEFEPKDEIKTVTFDQMEIRLINGLYETTIVFDINQKI